MAINRNRVPNIGSFKEKEVDNSYVSRSETRGIFNTIKDKVLSTSKFINDCLGLDHSNAIKETISNVSQDTYVRENNVDDTIMNDTSLDSEISMAYSICNDSIGIVRNSRVYDIEDRTSIISGVGDKLCSKITIPKDNSIVSNDNLGFNPYNNLTLSDIVESYKIGVNVYSIYRGGYVNVFDTLLKVSKNYKFIEVEDLYTDIKRKDDTIFNKFIVGNVVTNVTYDGSEKIHIITTDNLYTFNINTFKFNKVEYFTQSNEIILDIISTTKDLFYISKTISGSFDIFRFDIETESNYIYDIDNINAKFIPNTIDIIDGDIVIYRKNNKYSNNTNKFDDAIRYILIDKNDLYGEILSITEQELLTTTVIIEFILKDIDGLYIGIITEKDSIISNSVVRSFNGLCEIYDKNRGCVIETLPYSKAKLINNHIISTNGNCISVNNIVNGRVLSSNSYEIGLMRNTGNFIRNFNIIGGEVIITFSDNTHGVYDISALYKNNDPCISVIRTNEISHDKRFEFRINDKIVKFSYGFIETFENSNIRSHTKTNYNNPMSLDEFNNIIATAYNISSDNSINIVTVSKINGSGGINSRISLWNINHGTNASVNLVINQGWDIDCDTSDIKVKDNRFFIPVKCKTSTVFLIVCDVDSSEIFVNSTTVDSMFRPTVSDDCSCMSIGNSDATCTIPINNIFYNPQMVVGGVITHSINDLFDTSISQTTIRNIDIKCDRIYYDSNNLPIRKLYNFNNINYIKRGELSQSTFNVLKLKTYYLIINNKYLKLYDVNFKLINTKYIQYRDNAPINGYNVLSVYNRPNSDEFVINLDDFSIYIDLKNVVDSIESVNIDNKYSKCIKNDNIIVIDDNNDISIIDTLNNKSYSDIINRVDSGELYNVLFKTILNSVNRVVDKLYVSVSFVNSMTNTIINHSLFIIESNGNIIKQSYGKNQLYKLPKSKSKFVDSIVSKNNSYKMFYLNDNRIDCVNIESDNTITEHRSVYNFDKYSPIYIDIDETGEHLNISSVDVDSNIYKVKQHIPSNLNNSKSILPIVQYTGNCKFIVSNILNSVNVIKLDNISYEITSYWNSLVKIKNEVAISWLSDNFENIDVYYDNTGVKFLNNLTSDVKSINSTFSTIDCKLNNMFKIYNKTSTQISENTSDLFLDFYRRGFLSFDNYSGNISIFNDKLYECFGSFINLTNRIIIGYNVNDLDCLVYDTKDISMNTTSLNLDGYIRRINYIIDDIDVVMSKTYHVDYYNMIGNLTLTILNSGAAYCDNGGSNIRYIVDDINNSQNNTADVIYPTVSTAMIMYKDTNTFGYNYFKTVNLRTGDIITNNTVNNQKFIMTTFGDGVVHMVVRAAMNTTSYHTIINGQLSAGIPLSGFSNVIDICGVLNCNKTILMINNLGDFLIFDTTTGTYNKINIKSHVYFNGDNDLEFIKIIKFTSNLTCTMLVRNVITNKLFMIIGCNIDCNIINGGVNIFININKLGKLLSYKYNTSFSRLNSPSYDREIGSIFVNILHDNSSLINTYTCLVNICKILINKPLLESKVLDSETIECPYNSIQPRIFLTETFVILQYHDTIDIKYRSYKGNVIVSKDHINYIIKQDPQKTFKIINDVCVSGNKILLSFEDDSVRVIDYVFEGLTQTDTTYMDNGFLQYTEYHANDGDVNYFVLVNGIVGYIKNTSIYIDNFDGKFHKITSPKIKHYCLDTLYSRIYIVDDDNLFGVIDLIKREYTMIKHFHSDIINGLDRSVFGTIEIFTNTEVYSYYNYKIHNSMKISNLKNNIFSIIYPWSDVTIA